MITKSKSIQVRVSAEDKRKLLALAEKLDLPASQIIREGLRARLNAETQRKPKREAVIA